MYLLKSELCS